MNKLVTTILATSAAALGLFFAGTSASASTTYTVKSGDSVWAISQNFNTTINAIETANNINNHLIIAGEKLTIPDGSTTTSTTSTTTATNNAAATTSSNQAATSTYSQPATSTQSNTTSNTTTSNSSSYGSGSQSAVLSQMAARTGVSASTWNAIITRESNWQSGVVNSTSGAYGLFQNMHISSGDVQTQIDAAVSLYNTQGLSAWGY